MSNLEKLDTLDAEFTSFVRSLNREDANMQETMAAIDEKKSTLASDLEREFFRDVVYNWLWTEPESLADRRKAGELDMFMGTWKTYNSVRKEGAENVYSVTLRLHILIAWAFAIFAAGLFSGCLIMDAIH